MEEKLTEDYENFAVSRELKPRDIPLELKQSHIEHYCRDLCSNFERQLQKEITEVFLSKTRS